MLRSTTVWNDLIFYAPSLSFASFRIFLGEAYIHLTSHCTIVLSMTTIALDRSDEGKARVRFQFQAPNYRAKLERFTHFVVSQWHFFYKKKRCQRPTRAHADQCSKLNKRNSLAHSAPPTVNYDILKFWRLLYIQIDLEFSWAFKISR